MLAKISVHCYGTYILLFDHPKTQKIYSTIMSCIFIHLEVSTSNIYHSIGIIPSIHKFPYIIASQGWTETVGKHYHLAPGALVPCPRTQDGGCILPASIRSGWTLLSIRSGWTLPHISWLTMLACQSIEIIPNEQGCLPKRTFYAPLSWLEVP
jgi:hypothetical protein